MDSGVGGGATAGTYIMSPSIGVAHGKFQPLKQRAAGANAPQRPNRQAAGLQPQHQLAQRAAYGAEQLRQRRIVQRQRVQRL